MRRVMHLLCSGHFNWLDLVPNARIRHSSSHLCGFDKNLKKRLPVIFQKSFIIEAFDFFFPILCSLCSLRIS